MSTKTLPLIITVEHIQIEDLNLYPKQILSPGDKTFPIGNFEKLKLTVPAACNYTSEQSDASLIYTTKVTGTTYDDSNKTLQHRLQTKYHAYRITDIYKNKYLVGITEKPFPEIIFSPVIDASPDGTRAVNFEITWVSTLPPIDITEL